MSSAKKVIKKKVIKEKNYEAPNQERMTDKIKTDFIKYPHKMGNHFVIVPNDTNIKMKNGKKTTDVKYYWEQEDISQLIQNNFQFSEEKWYNIYLLQDEGWRMATSKIKKGKHLWENEERVLDCILDSDANNLKSKSHRVYAVEIEEIDTKEPKAKK